MKDTEMDTSIEQEKSVQRDWIEEYVKLCEEHEAAKQRLRNAERILARDGYRECDIPMCNCGAWHKGPLIRNYSDVLVTCFMPSEYANAEEFAKDCGLEIVGEPLSIDVAARQLAEHFGYDWSNIDYYRTGSCLIPSSQTNDEMCARADFMKIVKIVLSTIVLSPSEEPSGRRGDAPVPGQSGEGRTPGDAIVRAGTPGTGENLPIDRELELLRKIEELLIGRERLQAEINYVRLILDECKNDFHTCARCGEQDNQATTESNLWLMLDRRLNPKSTLDTDETNAGL